MKLSQSQQEWAAALVNTLLTKAVPKSQEECCAIAARAAIAVLGIPATDDLYFHAARGGAEGLFGPAFEAADEGQRLIWIDMYERALRDAAAEVTL